LLISPSFPTAASPDHEFIRVVAALRRSLFFSSNRQYGTQPARRQRSMPPAGMHLHVSPENH
jgi:hypothetical protein